MGVFRLVSSRPLLAITAVLVLSSPALAAVPPPKAGIDTYAQLPTPLPYPYDEALSAKATNAAVARARARALKAHKLLMIDLGGNWCGDCRVLSGALELPEMKAFVDRHYEVVDVDVGRFDKNLQVPGAYGIHHRLEGVPALLIVDPKTNRLLDKGRESALQDARSMTPQALADWLAQWPK
ncbi:thioredoxin family protein [Phenylobacterium sp.]|uniref:thioredoxin family protein n=1 Tax=Phenylobacterium sp. TaxID=1871053 RepID=UPI002DF07CB8|nr:thioredoxin family protein [Phenylobacterium sp.]